MGVTKNMQILIVKMSSLGDIIHAFPVVEYLKQCQPQCEIDWVVEHSFAELVRAHPLVRQAICVQTKKWRSKPLARSNWHEVAHFRQELRKITYDLVLDLQGNVKSGLVTASAKSQTKVGFNYASIPEWPNLLATHKRFQPPSGRNIRDDYLFLAQSAMGNFNQNMTLKGVQLNLSLEEKNQLQPIIDQLKHHVGLKVLVCPGSNWANKQLSTETLQSFLHSFPLRFNAHFLLIWGNSHEKTIAEEIASTMPQNSSVINRLSLPALQNLMVQVDLVLAMDSLPLHLAGSTSTPSYSIFGASSAQKYKPIGQCHQAFQGSCPYGKTFEKRCDILRTCKTGACIKQLQGEQLFNHFYEWWTSLNQYYHINK